MEGIIMLVKRYDIFIKKYLVFNDIFTSSGVASLFDSKESISAGKSILDKNGNLQIIRVSAILGKKEVKIFNRNEFSIKCANFNNWNVL